MEEEGMVEAGGGGGEKMEQLRAVGMSGSRRGCSVSSRVAPNRRVNVAKVVKKRGAPEQMWQERILAVIIWTAAWSEHKRGQKHRGRWTQGHISGATPISVTLPFFTITRSISIPICRVLQKRHILHPYNVKQGHSKISGPATTSATLSFISTRSVLSFFQQNAFLGPTI
ncbi:hypothetical protein E2C01_086568 [Portunus trituberculatus]|uniref:Uncharacterized protein n=1 Tax=Portunus trituberculatus TaxID=210409 RepID=A0A5B7JA22_PORTR|nr:hypothetical protein [Portunus trituberculatus]